MLSHHYGPLLLIGKLTTSFHSGLFGSLPISIFVRANVNLITIMIIPRLKNNKNHNATIYRILGKRRNPLNELYNCILSDFKLVSTVHLILLTYSISWLMEQIKKIQ